MEPSLAKIWEEVVAENYKRVYGHALHLTKNPVEAEDLTHTTLIQAQESFHAFRGTCLVSSWLYTITLNCFRMHCRRERSRRVAAAKFIKTTLPDEAVGVMTRKAGRGYDSDTLLYDLPQMDYTAEAHLTADSIYRFLSKGYRTVHWLYYGLGMTIDEVAKTVGHSPGTTKSQLYKARQRIADVLANPDKYNPAKQSIGRTEELEIKEVELETV